MNAVEIEEAISQLAEQEFDPQNFPFAFLEAFGNKPATIKRLKTGSTNSSDLEGGVLQRNNIHLSVCEKGKVSETLSFLKESPATKKGKVRFVLATDGIDFEAEDITSDEPPVVCHYKDFPDHFGFFLPLAGITTVKQIRESSFDIKATGRLNRLYIELLKDNPEWGTAERRHDMNHFMARLIFCFFAEDTGIFEGADLFTTAIQLSDRDSSNTHEVLSEIFRAMDVPSKDRLNANLPRWADKFPYVNGGLFSGSTEVPRFSKIARSYLIHIGNLDWTRINPDIFGSMIQAVTDEEERGALGLHYTSVPNILKVLNPLFLDDLRGKLEEAGNSSQKLLNLRKRIAKIRVFDPSCGSGNFLVIAYKEMRAIESEINKRRGEEGRRSEVPLTNFRGIELRDFPAEIARLALIIAEYQCDVNYLGQKEALAEFLPLSSENWIVCGNALTLDWLSICPPTGTAVKLRSDDLFGSSVDQSEIDFVNEGGETYICGNPPYLGSKWQSESQKAELGALFDGRSKNWKSLDYVAGWFFKAAEYGNSTECASAFVSTNSINQGQQVPILWPILFGTGHEISFAHTNFKWSNLANHNAGVTVVIVGLSKCPSKTRKLFSVDEYGNSILKEVDNINAYLVAGRNVEVKAASKPLNSLKPIQFGNHPYYGAPLILSMEEARNASNQNPSLDKYLKPFYGSKEFISSAPRACIWICDTEVDDALEHDFIRKRVESVKEARSRVLKDKTAQKLVEFPYRFREQTIAEHHVMVIPRVSSENRPYLPVGFLGNDAVIQEKAFAMYDSPIWYLSIIASRIHLVWVGTVCARMRTDFSYSNTLGWNTFPVPKLTEKNKEDLTKCAEEILLAREAHFPATIADLYSPEKMPEDLRRAHEKNDEVLERIYIGRRFRNDTERLEKLFDMYTKMTNSTSKKKVS